jgi:manganese transport protein
MDMRQTAPVPVRSPRRAVVLGSGALIAVGYMDPGNWATDLQAGAQ